MISRVSIHILLIIDLTMLYLLSITYILSLWMLIQTPDNTVSSNRFWIKVLTCIHPLLIILVAYLSHFIETIEMSLLWALIFALLGDLSLGLKHRFKAAMAVGIFFFSMTHMTLSVLFFEGSWFIWTLLLVLCTWAILFKLLSKRLLFGAYTKMVTFYAFVILMMFGLASSSLILNLDLHHFILWLGALSFLISDTLLSQKYFSKTKTTWIIIGYLVLYHLALSLFVLSAFI